VLLLPVRFDLWRIGGSGPGFRERASGRQQTQRGGPAVHSEAEQITMKTLPHCSSMKLCCLLIGDAFGNERPLLQRLLAQWREILPRR
jgi:hypothetical protein